MNKFKAGDRVVIVGSDYIHVITDEFLAPGHRGTVLKRREPKTSHGDQRYVVQIDGQPAGRGHEGGWAFHEHQLELTNE